jgi:hypothetical protein
MKSVALFRRPQHRLKPILSYLDADAQHDEGDDAQDSLRGLRGDFRVILGAYA